MEALVRDRTPKPCEFQPCKNWAEKRGYCGAHYGQLRKAGGDAQKLVQLRAPELGRRKTMGLCEFPDCGAVAVAHRLCMGHVQQANCGTGLKRLRSSGSPIEYDEDGAYIWPGNSTVQKIRLSPEDIGVAGEHQWSLGDNGYPRTRTLTRELDVTIWLHQVVLEAAGGPRKSGYVADHINGVRTDCRRENLRWVTRSQNAQNRGVRRGSFTGVRGVGYDKVKGLYRGAVTLDGIRYSVGRSKNLEVVAARVSALRQKLHEFTNEERARRYSQWRDEHFGADED